MGAGFRISKHSAVVVKYVPNGVVYPKVATASTTFLLKWRVSFFWGVANFYYPFYSIAGYSLCFRLLF